MCDILPVKTMNRRQFTKCCLLGMGGFVIGWNWLDKAGGLSVKEFDYSPASDGLWKWSKEALFYIQMSNGVKCLKCPHECYLEPGEVGICRNRLNYQGKLYSIAYGNPCAVHIDPIEKKPFYHFYPATRAFSIACAGCNLRCLNCQNWEISQFSPRETENIDLMPSAVVEACVNSACESIAYTYSEPTTFYEYTLDTAMLARRKKIKNVLKSSGYINEEPLRKLGKYLDAANIDLKAFDNGIYQRLSSAKLAPVLNTLKVLKEEGVWLEITNLVVPSWTDNLEMIKSMCDWLVQNGLQDCPLHFTRFTPLYKLTQLPLTPVSTLEKARDIALQAGVKYAYVGNVPTHPAENTYCHQCGKMIIERRGFFILNNHIVKSKCKFCGAKIPGVWSE
ncbi:MAG: AmmeMemoRadiSam system radical SAM enzyme [candidate division KSB1 bacterium]|nr:AmmeMemoRadiSam system radical SAM enzyme [candidate division KSB1 bacterium]MDZ7303105.1 AmmeMemoRadiSam system radical SAM enzyme [candidate division KSB1 bacterium]MDZ7312644.1 AmmeMemoRadiSam system radical SAM enzyme [candidate division KSB1 bacterium]